MVEIVETRQDYVSVFHCDVDVGYVTYQCMSQHFQPFTRDHKMLRPQQTQEEAVNVLMDWYRELRTSF